MADAEIPPRSESGLTDGAFDPGPHAAAVRSIAAVATARTRFASAGWPVHGSVRVPPPSRRLDRRVDHRTRSCACGWAWITKTHVHNVNLQLVKRISVELKRRCAGSADVQMQETPCPAAPQPDRPPGHDRRQETRRDSKSHRSRNRSCPVVPLVELAAGDLRRAGEHSIAGREQGGQRVVRARGRRDARIGGPRRGYGHDRREQECREPVHQETLRDALASHLCLSVLFLIPLSTQDLFVLPGLARSLGGAHSPEDQYGRSTPRALRPRS